MISFDRFDNLVLTNEKTINSQELKDLIENNKKNDKGIILKNFETNVIDDLKEEYEILHMITRDHQNVYLIKNNSNCPELYNGTMSAAGVSVLIKYQDNYYGILMKDKTKSILTCPGGTCEQKALLIKDGLKETAVRELREETEGVVTISGSEYHTKGMLLNKDQVTTLAEYKMMSSYYGFDDIPDTYTCYQYMIEYDKDNQNKEFFDYLFHESNKDKNGNYTLKYVSHNETQYVHASIVKNININNDFEQVINDIRKELPVFDCYSSNHPRVSIIHILSHYANMNKINNTFVLENKSELKKLGFPPYVSKVTLHSKI